MTHRNKIPQAMSSYSDTLKEIEALEGRGIHRGLDRTEAALRLLGNPHNRFPVIHIAGTNGKGSTAAFTSEILRKSGYKAGLLISPHIEDFRERIQVNRHWIVQESVTSIHHYLKKKVGHIPLTYYEWSLLMAFLYFAETRVDVAVLETGMGGRWDATNVVSPLVAAITNVSLDHEAYLGSRLEDILVEKMQILKPGVPAWTAIENDSLFLMMKQYCQAQKSPLYRLSDFFQSHSDETFSVFDYRHLTCGLPGTHQNKNAALAIALCQTLKGKGYSLLKKRC